MEINQKEKNIKNSEINHSLSLNGLKQISQAFRINSRAAQGVELLIYVIICTLVLIHNLLTTWNLSKEEGPNYDIYKWKLSTGYMFGRQMDNSDKQYSLFRANLPSLIALMLIYELITAIVTPFVKRRMFSNSNNEIHATSFKLYVSLFFSGIVTIVLCGFGAFKLFGIYYVNYKIAKYCKGNRKTPFIIWGYCLGLLFAVNFVDMDKIFLISKHAKWISKFNGLGHDFRISFNFAILRMLSFGMDHYWKHTITKSEQKQNHAKHCYECRCNINLGFIECKKARVEESLDMNQYNIVNYFAYVLYFPLSIAGPIITFNDFVSQSNIDYSNSTKKNNDRARNTILYGIRWAAMVFLMEVSMHSFHVIAISSEHAWVGMTPYQIMMVGFYTLNHIWLKLMIIWRFFRLWAMIDGIDTEENMTRCMTNQHSPAEFWRTWHRSYNKWIIRYLYVPLGGKQNFVWNVWFIFSFVAIWHDIRLHLLAWGWLIALFLIPEYLLKGIFADEKHKSRVSYRYLSSIGATINILIMMVVNLIGFSVGLDGMYSFLKQMMRFEGMVFFTAMVMSIFCLVQLQFSLRDFETRKKIHYKSQ